MNRLIVITLLAASTVGAADRVSLDNGLVRRDFALKDGIWRTVAFSGRGSTLPVSSDEFHIRLFDDTELTAADYVSVGAPETGKGCDDSTFVALTYARQPNRVYSTNAPRKIEVTYNVFPGQPYLRKSLRLEFLPHAAIDRLEVERFAAEPPAAWGGRGQPVYVGDRWFFGLEHPAGHSRHTDGNTPAPDSHHFEVVGNYSIVYLEDRDRETHPRPGLMRLFHFPGYAKEVGGTWRIDSQTAVAGVSQPGQTMELAFFDYLDTVRKKPRSFTHYNNWFDPAGKSLKGDNFVNVWKEFHKVLDPAGIHLDAMVPDNGWQNGASIWQPSGAHFPGGMDDLAKLGQRLKEEGTQLGLWLSLDSTTGNIGWGEKNGYAKAKANAYFSRYFAHYCLAAPPYRAEMERQLRELVRRGQLNYFKHDFNHLSCLANGHGHAPTDRHGHEANVDAMIELLELCRKENPDLFQNLTNWIWYSPWWLMHGDALWFLAGDDGVNGNTPELSTRAMATTDRDAYLWRMWGNPQDRPLVPISHLMTHGFVKNPGGMMESKQDTIADWADHVWMYYGRGVQMKEWYLTPSVMTTNHWQPILDAHRWAQSNFAALVNTVFVGGRPDDGQVYGYVGWTADRGVLVTRNPSVQAQTLRVPCDATTLFRGRAGDRWSAQVVYPYRDAWPVAYRTGEDMAFELPGFSTMVFELRPGRPGKAAMVDPLPEPKVARTPKAIEATVQLPRDVAGRADLLVIGHADLPIVTINGEAAMPYRTSKSAINHFAGYARSGMPSTNATPWQMAAYDLSRMTSSAGQISFKAAAGSESTTFEAWLLTERQPAGGEGLRRQTRAMVERTTLSATPVERRAFTAAELAAAKQIVLRLEVFGINGGEFGAKEAWLNGARVGALPECGDDWKVVTLPIARDHVAPVNTLEVRHNGREDKFKFRGAEICLLLEDSTVIASGRQSEPQTSFAGWSFAEGATFATPTSSVPVRLTF